MIFPYRTRFSLMFKVFPCHIRFSLRLLMMNLYDLASITPRPASYTLSFILGYRFCTSILFLKLIHHMCYDGVVAEY